MQLDKAQIGLAGEYYVLAQLRLCVQLDHLILNKDEEFATIEQ